MSSTLVTALRCTTPDAERVFPLLPHPTAITAAAVKTIVSNALELDGRLIGEVISGPFSWFLSRASLVLRPLSPLALAEAGWDDAEQVDDEWPVGRNLAGDEWAWVLGHIRGLPPLGHDMRGRAWEIRPHDLPLSGWLLAHDVRVLMVFSLQPVSFGFGLFTSHGCTVSRWCLFMIDSSDSFS